MIVRARGLGWSRPLGMVLKFGFVSVCVLFTGGFKTGLFTGGFKTGWIISGFKTGLSTGRFKTQALLKKSGKLMLVPSIQLPPFLKTVLDDIQSCDFCAADNDYGPEGFNEIQYVSVTPDHAGRKVLWLRGDDGLSWSFHLNYFTADESETPESDAAMVELGIGVNFDADDVDSTLIVGLELWDQPPEEDFPITKTRVAIPTAEAWCRFKEEQLEEALTQAQTMADERLEDWSEDETDDDDNGTSAL